MNLKSIFAACCLFAAVQMSAKDVTYNAVSPDGHLSASVVVGTDISYGVSRLVVPSQMTMTLSDGVVFGENDKVRKLRRQSVDTTVPDGGKVGIHLAPGGGCVARLTGK